ncbi:hypothetical protein CASFOL_013986 [Castilleja foliolosa]|uniref:Uncharacterized protein n=1 Tax=Castilleja foliolosa TaxID=1961234 RepID=A0ABD3DNA5_9LAMI
MQILKHAATIYTPEILELFQEEQKSEKAYEIARDGLQKLLDLVDASFEDDEVHAPRSTGAEATNAWLVNSLDSTVNDNIIDKRNRGIKPKEKVTYKTSKRPRSCLGKASKKKETRSKVQISNNHDTFVEQSSIYEGSKFMSASRYSEDFEKVNATWTTLGNENLDLANEVMLSQLSQLQDYIRNDIFN